MDFIRICAFCNKMAEEILPCHYICRKCNYHCSYPLIQTVSQSIMFNIIDDQLIFEDVQKYIFEPEEKYLYTLVFIFESTSIYIRIEKDFPPFSIEAESFPTLIIETVVPQNIPINQVKSFAIKLIKNYLYV